MASMSMMTSSFLGGSSVAAMITKQLPTTTTNRHGQLSIRASNTIKVAQGEKIALKNNQEEESVNGRRRRRRGLVFGGVAAVAVAFSLSKNAMADDDTEEPKRGTPEAKKKYAPVCVTNPTARICRR